MSKGRSVGFSGKRRFAALLGQCAVLSLGVPGVALAQGQQTDAESRIARDGDIIVTAQFREQRLQDIPIAITAISADMMEARSQTSIADIANQSPNVLLKPQGAAFGPALGASIRGIGQFDFNPAMEPGVGVYIDDVYFPTITGALFDLLDLDRVEILRGPQGTLAGKNSIGGAIKLYSRKPSDKPDASISATYGARQRLDLRAASNFTLADGLYARVAGVTKRQGGYVERRDYGCDVPSSGVPPQRVFGDCVMAHEGDINYSAVRGQLRYVSDDRIEINLSADYTHDDRNAPGTVLTYAATYAGTADINPFDVPLNFDSRFVPPRGSYYNYATFINAKDGPQDETRFDGRSKLNGWGVAGNIDWKLTDNLALTSITSYRAYDAEFSNDNDLSPLAINLGFNHLKFHAVSQELRLSGSALGDMLHYTLGGFYLDQKTIFAGQQDLRSSRLVFFQRDVVTADTKAVFGHVSLDVTDQLTLVGGLRYTDEGKDYLFVRKTRSGDPQSVLDGSTFRYSGSKVDYRASVQYRFSDEAMGYAQVSTGIKGGGVSPRPFIAGQAQPFGPETVTSYEIGAKTDLFDRAVRLNTALFLAKYKGIQLTRSSCPEFGAAPFCGVTANAGNGDLKGFEVELNVRPGGGLLFDGSLSYIDWKYTYINPSVGGPDRPTGVQLYHTRPNMPAWKWSAGLQYDFVMDKGSTITPRFDISYQGKMYTSLTNTATSQIDGYVLANARLKWTSASQDWEVSAEVTNIFGKYYFLTIFDEAALGGRANGQPGRPREWAVSVKRSF